MLHTLKIILSLLLMLVIGGLVLLYLCYLSLSLNTPSEPVKLEPLPAVLTANLGGAPARIPRAYLGFLEFDKKGDGLRSSPDPNGLRKIRSFGFEVRYPDMTVLSPETHADYKSKTIYNTDWFRIGVNSNSFCDGCFADNNPIEGLVNGISSELNFKGPEYYYAAEPDKFHGLEVWNALGPSGPVRLSYKKYPLDTLYVGRDSKGAVIAYIRCSNAPHEAAPCQQRFTLYPELKTSIRVSYRKGWLPKWEDIQNKTKNLVKSFTDTNTLKD